MKRTFNQCSLLKVADLSNWNMSNVIDVEYMFNSSSLQELKTPGVYPSDSNVSISLPLTLYDGDDRQYISLNNESPTKALLKIRN